MQEKADEARASRGGQLLESAKFPRIGIVGEPGRMIETAVFKGERAEHIIVTSLSPQAVNGVGLSPDEALKLSADLLKAVSRVKRA